MGSGMDRTGRPRRQRLVIHAGLGKTGSSAIQKYCRDHPQQLRSQGALYLGMILDRAETSPLDFASAAELQDALDNDPAIEDRLLRLIRSKIKSRPGVETFVWSQISLATYHELLGRVIARLKPVCDVEVVLYFRHQAEWLVSAYLQWGVKHKTEAGPILSFADWIPKAASRGSDYVGVVEGWVAAVGRERLHLRPYAAARDVVEDFLTVARLGTIAPNTRDTRHYETPDDTLMMLFRMQNGQHDDPALPGALYRLIVECGMERKRYRDISPSSTLPSGTDWEAFAASFEADNALLAREYGLEIGPPGPGPAPDPAHAAPATAIPALLDMIIAMDKRIAVLEQQVKERHG